MEVGFASFHLFILSNLVLICNQNNGRPIYSYRFSMTSTMSYIYDMVLVIEKKDCPVKKKIYYSDYPQKIDSTIKRLSCDVKKYLYCNRLF